MPATRERHEAAKLDELCTGYGLPQPQVYPQDWFVNELVSEPGWRQRLLGVGGQLGPLLERPLDTLEPATPAPILVGRDAELSALRTLVGERIDVVLAGIIGNGMVAFGIGAAGPIVVKKIARYVESLLPDADDGLPQVEGGDSRAA